MKVEVTAWELTKLQNELEEATQKVHELERAFQKVDENAMLEKSALVALEMFNAYVTKFFAKIGFQEPREEKEQGYYGRDRSIVFADNDIRYYLERGRISINDLDFEITTEMREACKKAFLKIGVSEQVILNAKYANK